MQRRLAGFALALCGLVLVGSQPSRAADEHAGHAGHSAEVQAPEGTQVHFSDVVLTDQHGRPARLKDEVVSDRIVVMGFIYTSCTTVCPVVSAIMQKVQTRLGERVGSEVQLVSISVDPLRDTPQRLHEYASHFRAGPGWTWLTGPVPAVRETHKGLGTWSADLTAHPPVIMVGDGRSGEWTRYYGFTDPAVLVARVDALGAARQQQDHAMLDGHAMHGHDTHATHAEGRP
jgi:protein SCO1/2